MPVYTGESFFMVCELLNTLIAVKTLRDSALYINRRLTLTLNDNTKNSLHQMTESDCESGMQTHRGHLRKQIQAASDILTYNLPVATQSQRKFAIIILKT